MRKQLFMLLITLLIISGHGIAQKIVMKIPSITDKFGEEVRTLAFSIDANTSWTKGGGASVGKPNPGSLVIRKSNNKSTSDFMKTITTGNSIPEITFEYYEDSPGGGREMGKSIYTITITAAFLTELSWLTPDCSNCPKLEQKVAFVYKTLKVTDATGKSVTWDIPAGTVN